MLEVREGLQQHSPLPPQHLRPLPVRLSLPQLPPTLPPFQTRGQLQDQRRAPELLLGAYLLVCCSGFRVQGGGSLGLIISFTGVQSEGHCSVDLLWGPAWERVLPCCCMFATKTGGDRLQPCSLPHAVVAGGEGQARSCADCGAFVYEQ